MIPTRSQIQKFSFPCRIADRIETLRRTIPKSIRKIIPRKVKDSIIDFEWQLYRSKNLELKHEVSKPKNPILIISIPKTGTNLAKSLVLSLPGTYSREHFPSGVQEVPNYTEACCRYRMKLQQAHPGEVYSWHTPFSHDLAQWLNKSGIKKIFIYRDPRDYTVSLHYFIKNKYLIRPATFYEIFSHFRNDDEKLMRCIQGINEKGSSDKDNYNYLQNVREVYEKSLGWL